MDAYAMPRLPLPWSWTLTPLAFGWRTIEKYDMHFVVAGTSHLALLPAVKGLPYILWIATIYEDELRSKVEVGDAWASRVLNSPVWPLLQAQERFTLRKASRILALSPNTARRITEVVPETADRIVTMLCPVDTERFRPDPAARAMSPYGDYLLFTGRINDPRKNVDLLLRVFAIVRERFPALKLVLVGEEPGKMLLASVKRLGLDDAVVFPGRIAAGSEFVRLYQAAKLFALPSTQEGLGIVALEALACGTPVVSTRCGGPEELLSAGQVGQLVPKDDPDAFAQALLDLLSDPDRLAKMREASVKLAQERFAWAAIERQLLDAIETVFPAQLAHLDKQ